MGVETYDEIGALFAFWSSVLFLIGYSLLAKWWKHQVGWTVASFDFGLIIAMMPSALHYVLGLNLRDVFFAWYYGCSLILVGLIAWARLAIIAWVQVHDAPVYEKPRIISKAGSRDQSG